VDQLQLVWSESFRVRAYEVDVWGRASALTVCNWLQEAAGNHATHLGWGIEGLHAQGLTWLLSRLHVRLNRLPPWREEVRVTTWPAGAHRLWAVREFRLTGAAGDEVGVATTGWMVVNLATRRPMRPAADVVAMGKLTPPRALDDAFEKLPEVERVAFARTLEVRISDLDINRHANNVSVVGWGLESLPLETLEGRELADFEIEFRGEAKAGERVTSEAEAADASTFVHRLMRVGDGREIARARSRWR
jgi:medium-chain acyl-[acyl-carrier-protein] hydrolase